MNRNLWPTQSIINNEKQNLFEAEHDKQKTPGLALLLWRFLLTEGDPGWPGLEVAEVVTGRPEEEVEVGACCWDTFCSSAASCLGSTPGDLGGRSPRGRHDRYTKASLCKGTHINPWLQTEAWTHTKKVFQCNHNLLPTKTVCGETVQGFKQTPFWSPVCFFNF